jgi:secondary thiamine-phosphate synthase enzyme
VKTFQAEHKLRTAGGLTVTDITEDVQEAVRRSGITDGICSVYSAHTTCSVRVNEWERGFLEDFAVLLKRLVPTERYSAHDERPTENTAPEHAQRVGIGNRRALCMSMLLGPPGESIPVRDGELSLGTWQRVLFLELDPERDGHWLVQVDGV